MGICTKEGVILAVEKKVSSPLLESNSIEKIKEIDRHIGCAMSGLIADSATMVDHARITCQVREKIKNVVKMVFTIIKRRLLEIESYFYV